MAYRKKSLTEVIIGFWALQSKGRIVINLCMQNKKLTFAI